MGGNWHSTTNYAEKLPVTCYSFLFPLNLSDMSAYIVLVISILLEVTVVNIMSGILDDTLFIRILWSPVSEIGYFFWSYWQVRSQRPPNVPMLLVVRLLLRTSHMWLRAQRYQAGTHLKLPSYCLTLIMFEGAMHTIANPTHHYLIQELCLDRAQALEESVLLLLY